MIFFKYFKKNFKIVQLFPGYRNFFCRLIMSALIFCLKFLLEVFFWIVIGYFFHFRIKLRVIELLLDFDWHIDFIGRVWVWQFTLVDKFWFFELFIRSAFRLKSFQSDIELIQFSLPDFQGNQLLHRRSTHEIPSSPCSESNWSSEKVCSYWSKITRKTKLKST